MNNIEKIIKYNSLLEIYHPLLSKQQQEVMEQYFNFNLSIGEIALNKDVSRSAIEDAISKGTKKLDELENNLHLLEKRENIQKILNDLKNENNEFLQEKIKEIERNL